MSSHHAELSFLPGGRVLLTDCHSTNGTYRLTPDGRALRIHQELIVPIDRLRFGRIDLSGHDLLERLHLSTPPGPGGTGAAPGPQPPLVMAERLVRGACGHVQPAGGPCPECGR